MKVTNVHNLPESFVNAMTWDARKPDSNRMSVTDLIGPPQIRKLKIQHWDGIKVKSDCCNGTGIKEGMKCQKCEGRGYVIKDELEDDIGNRLWLLLGKSIHYVLEKGAPDEARAEEKLTFEIDGFTLVGITDLLHNTELSDYKITSVYSFLLGDKPEWENQLNCNAFLYRKAGFQVASLKIYAILRDWQSSKVDTSADYPEIPFKEVSIPLWPIEGQERYIKSRIEAHKMETPACSNEERWLRGEKWAVYKKGNKTAFRLFDTEEEANGLFATNPIFEVRHRPGTFNRCKKPCPVRTFCKQNKEAL